MQSLQFWNESKSLFWKKEQYLKMAFVIVFIQVESKKDKPYISRKKTKYPPPKKTNLFPCKSICVYGFNLSYNPCWYDSDKRLDAEGSTFRTPNTGFSEKWGVIIRFNKLKRVYDLYCTLFSFTCTKWFQLLFISSFFFFLFIFCLKFKYHSTSTHWPLSCLKKISGCNL